MKKIVDYRKLLEVGETATLQELRSAYRGFVKTWHPDKFQDAELKLEAEEKSKTIIEAYHFLVSIAPETREQTMADYTVTISSGITDFEYKSQTLTVYFADGNTYEYFDVTKAEYTKMINSDSPGRFARRHIFGSHVYRSTSRLVAGE